MKAHTAQRGCSARKECSFCGIEISRKPARTQFVSHPVNGIARPTKESPPLALPVAKCHCPHKRARRTELHYSVAVAALKHAFFLKEKRESPYYGISYSQI